MNYLLLNHKQTIHSDNFALVEEKKSVGRRIFEIVS